MKFTLWWCRWPWPWPLPAVLAWSLAWCVFRLAVGQGVAPGLGVAAACGLGVACSGWGESWWRRLLIAAGFPLSLGLLQGWAPQAAGAATMPSWVWLLALALLALVYPVNAWRDAPFFPTPADALVDLPSHAPLADEAVVLDAGCGLGHGLAALRRAYPRARVHGVEWSWPLRWLCSVRCPWACVRRGDIWAADWSAYDLVYLFQRPESMERAATKAAAQLRPGSWLVSLEFNAPLWSSTSCYRAPGGKMVWIYRAPFTPVTGE